MKATKAALESDLGSAEAQYANLQATGVPASDYTVMKPARAGTAVLVPGGPSLLDHRTVRAPLGLLVGVLLGCGLTYVADALDHRLRTAQRASEAFALPVVVEIPGDPPAWQPFGPRPTPVVDVVVDPLSDAAEAYRKLHVAMRLSPLVLWVRHGNPWGRQQWDPPPAVGPAGGGTPEMAPVPEPVPVGARLAHTRAATATRPVGRRVFLVTSPGDEPTRSLVVANLAAVVAESGQRVLVATTGGLRTRLEFDDRPGLPVSPLGPDPGPDAIVGNARPSQLPGVSSLALGQVVDNPSKLAMLAPGIIRSALEVVDVVLLEAPLLTTQDAEALFPVVDAVVVVAESWLTTVDEGVRAGRLLARHRAHVVGVALTHVADGPPLPWRRDSRAAGGQPGSGPRPPLGQPGRPSPGFSPRPPDVPPATTVVRVASPAGPATASGAPGAPPWAPPGQGGMAPAPPPPPVPVHVNPGEPAAEPTRQLRQWPPPDDHTTHLSAYGNPSHGPEDPR